MILYLFDIKKITKKKLIFRMKIYMYITLFALAFGFVYEHFGHGILSYFMVYAFVIPLLAWIVPCACLYSKMPREIPELSLATYDAFVVTYMVGFMYKGMLEIYGTTNKLSAIYFVIGSALFLTAIILYILLSEPESD